MRYANISKNINDGNIIARLCDAVYARARDTNSHRHAGLMTRIKTVGRQSSCRSRLETRRTRYQQQSSSVRSSYFKSVVADAERFRFPPPSDRYFVKRLYFFFLIYNFRLKSGVNKTKSQICDFKFRLKFFFVPPFHHQTR